MGLPEGMFSLLVGEAAVGEALVGHPADSGGWIYRVAAGRASVDCAGRSARVRRYRCTRSMSSINPVFLLPSALAERAETIAQGLIDSVTLGTGQFCTKPGVVVGLAGGGL